MKLPHETKAEEREALHFAVVLLALVAATLWCACAYSQETQIADLVSGAPKHPMRNAEARSALADEIRTASTAHDVPVMLLLTVAFCESSLNAGAVGAIGEIGIVQVHGAAAAGCDLSTRSGQLDCGAAWLRHGYDRCGSWRGALTAYATGRCKPHTDRVRRLVEYRMRMWKKMEEE